jgi:hypothetical protein
MDGCAFCGASPILGGEAVEDLKRRHKDEIDQLQELALDKFKRAKQKAKDREKELQSAQNALNLELGALRGRDGNDSAKMQQEVKAAKSQAKKLVRQAEDTMSGMCADLKEAKAEATRDRERAASLEAAMLAKEAEFAAELEKVKNEAKQQMAKQVDFFGKMQRHQKNTVKQEVVKEEQTKSAVKQETLAASLLEQQAELKQELQKERDANAKLRKQLGDASDEVSMAQATARSLEESGGVEAARRLGAVQTELVAVKEAKDLADHRLLKMGTQISYLKNDSSTANKAVELKEEELETVKAQLNEERTVAVAQKKKVTRTSYTTLHCSLTLFTNTVRIR